MSYRLISKYRYDMSSSNIPKTRRQARQIPPVQGVTSHLATHLPVYFESLPSLILEVASSLNHSCLKSLSLVNRAIHNTVRPRLLANVDLCVSNHGVKGQSDIAKRRRMMGKDEAVYEIERRVGQVLERTMDENRIVGRFSMITGITIAPEHTMAEDLMDILDAYRLQLQRLSIFSTAGPYSAHLFFAALLRSPRRPFPNLIELELVHYGCDEYRFLYMIASRTPRLRKLEVWGQECTEEDKVFSSTGSLEAA
jgi:hypothetical protein